MSDEHPTITGLNLGTEKEKFAIEFPDVPEKELAQDEEYCLVRYGGMEKKIRFHDYHDIYDIPGLYEKIFYDKLECQSPSLLGTLLTHEVERLGLEMNDLTVLDVGAGNGIMGEVLAEAGVDSLVGVDILEEAAMAAERDRPGLYDAYYPVNLLDIPSDVEKSLTDSDFNCLTTVAALGFGDIPPQVFATAYNFIEDGGFVAFNLKDEFLQDGDSTGFAGLIERMTQEQWLEQLLRVRYVHRLSMSGDPLHYTGVIGRKLCDVPPALVMADTAD